MKKLIAVMLVSLMLLCSCGAKMGNGTVKGEIPDYTLSIAEQNYLKMIPQMTKENDEIYQKYIKPFEASDLFSQNFSKNDLSAVKSETLMTMFGICANKEDIKALDFDYTGNVLRYYKVPFKMIKDEVLPYFKADSGSLKKALKADYSVTDKTYKYYGIPASVSAINRVTGYKLQNNTITVNIDGYSASEIYYDGKITPFLCYSSVLTVKIDESGGFKYISNAVQRHYRAADMNISRFKFKSVNLGETSDNFTDVMKKIESINSESATAYIYGKALIKTTQIHEYVEAVTEIRVTDGEYMKLKVAESTVDDAVKIYGTPSRMLEDEYINGVYYDTIYVYDMGNDITLNVALDVNQVCEITVRAEDPAGLWNSLNPGDIVAE